MITFDPWSFFVPSVLSAFWAYRIHAKRGSDNWSFLLAVVLATVLFGIGIFVGPLG